MEFLLQKMKSAQDEQVQYWLGDGTQQINLNALIGHTLTFEFTGAIFCQECQKKIKKYTRKVSYEYFVVANSFVYIINPNKYMNIRTFFNFIQVF